MRQARLVRIFAGILLGIGGRIVFNYLRETAAYESVRGNAECPPCQDPNKIRGQPCPFCGPHQILADEDSTIAKPYKPKGMYEITRWQYYNEDYMYDIINGAPKVNLTAGSREETVVVTQLALEYINAHKMLGKQWYLHRLRSGYLRNDVFRGTDYFLDIGVKSVENFQSESLEKTFRVRMVHAFEDGETSLKVISSTEDKDAVVHIIGLVSGNEEALERFIKNFAKKRSHNEKLTLVLFYGKGQFGEESIMLKPIIDEQIKQLPEMPINYIELDGDYDFAQGVTQAATQVSKNSIILTLNIDMYYGENLLKSCRMIPIPGKRVYFPIAFSQYDPDVIERGMPPGKPKDINKMDINKFTGYWMYKKHDVICAYKKDLIPVLHRALLAVESRSNSLLYNYFLSDDFEVISAVEPDLIRIFRQRHCDKRFMLDEEYDECFESAVEMLGSKPALSILYLTEIAMKKMR